MKKRLPLLFLLLCSACSTTVAPPVPDNSVRLSTQEITLNDLAFYAMSLDGTPYQWGGESPDSGFDCSGFVRHVFEHTARVQLPRTSRELSRSGDPIDIAELRPGDLVFFRTTGAFSHVGIFIGESRFVHAPRVGGKIRVENIHSSYWRPRFNGARRIKV